jgi:hypothetical protein
LTHRIGAQEIAMPPQESISTVDDLAARIRVDLTVIKSVAQLLGRRDWSLSDADHAHLTDQLRLIDRSVDHAGEFIKRLESWTLAFIGEAERDGQS